MSTFTPLGPVNAADSRCSNPPLVSEFRVLKKLSVLNPAKSSGPDMIPSWLLKENADLLAPAVTDIINCSFGEACLPQSWKHADIVPIPKQMPVYDVNMHLRPISLTPALSKVAEEFMVEQHVKPAVLEKMDPGQFGTIPGSSTTEALISMTHAWYSATDGNGATVRAVLFDFKKAFDLIDHGILVQKLRFFNIPVAVILWITDFLSCHKQRVKLGQDFFSEFFQTPSFNPIVINDKQIDVVSHAKILGVNISSNLKWNHHISEVVKKARKRLFCLSQLKRACLGPNELVQFYRTCILPITEYACPVFHDGLPVYLSHELEAVQKRAMRIIFHALCMMKRLLRQAL